MQKTCDLGYTQCNSSIVFDYDDFIGRVMKDDILARKIIEIFIDNSPKEIQQLKQSFLEHDFDTVRYLAHSIKGTTSNVGLLLLSNVSASIENAAKSGDNDSIALYIPELERQFRNALFEIEAKMPSIQLSE